MNNQSLIPYWISILCNNHNNSHLYMGKVLERRESTERRSPSIFAEPSRTTLLSLLSELVELGHPDAISLVITIKIKLARLIYHRADNKALLSYHHACNISVLSEHFQFLNSQKKRHCRPPKNSLEKTNSGCYS